VHLLRNDTLELFSSHERKKPVESAQKFKVFILVDLKTSTKIIFLLKETFKVSMGAEQTNVIFLQFSEQSFAVFSKALAPKPPKLTFQCSGEGGVGEVD
jgi:hypothetical protein